MTGSCHGVPHRNPELESDKDHRRSACYLSHHIYPENNRHLRPKHFWKGERLNFAIKVVKITFPMLPQQATIVAHCAIKVKIAT